MSKKCIKVLLGLFCLSSFVYAQSSTEKNYLVIKPTDTPEDIVHKAAMLTPTPRQLRWQQLEIKKPSEKSEGFNNFF